MLVLPEALSMRLLDGIACALLAAAATARARGQGAHFTGAVVLGALCGLIGPLLREAFAHGQPGTARIMAEMPNEALVGALGVFVGMYLVHRTRIRLFFWLDSASIGLASSIGAISTLNEIGIVGAIGLGLINGLAPGLVRDMALGDTAMLVDRDWYATAAALGCIAAIAVLLWLSIGWVTEWTATHASETAVLAGFVVVLSLRAWKGRPGSDCA